MKKKITNKGLLCILALSIPQILYGTIAYIPQTLKECIKILNDINITTDSKKNLDDLYSIITENRILVTDTLVHAAIKEALKITKKNYNKFKCNAQRKAIKNYLKTYAKSLNDTSLLLAMKTDNAHSRAWPISLISQSILPNQHKNYSIGFDIIRLNSELICTENIPLCGIINFDSTANHPADTELISNISKEISYINRAPHNIIFNPNMMSNSLSATPQIVFGTGASSPSINAWIIQPSFMTQSPINVQFPIPQDFSKNSSISLELHFLVTQTPTNSGYVRFKVQSKFLKDHHSFAISTSNPPYTHTSYSKNIKTTEPTAANSVKHMIINIPLKNSHIIQGDLALLAITRDTPTKNPEYQGDIYLAAALFKYNS